MLVTSLAATEPLRAASPAAPSNYSTSFSLTENPISEGGKWITGKTVGLLWNDIQSAANVDGNGRGGFAGAPTAVSFDDSIAHPKKSFIAFSANQYARGTVYRKAGYSAGHEIELHVRQEITANNARGYECYWSTNDGIYIVRWNGGRGDFLSIANSDGHTATTGDVLELRAVDSTISALLNGSQILSVTDSTWSDGQPGIGAGPYPTVNTLTSYGWSSWEAGNL